MDISTYVVVHILCIRLFICRKCLSYVNIDTDLQRVKNRFVLIIYQYIYFYFEINWMTKNNKFINLKKIPQCEERNP